MDRAAEFPLQSSMLWPARHCCKRKRQGKNFGCLLAFCLLAVFLLALPVFYLLARHLREQQACKAEEPAERMPEFQKQTSSSPELKPRAHMIALKTNDSTCVPRQTPFPPLQWKHNQDLNSAAMEYKNGYLVIPKPGDYFVYAQVTFRSTNVEKDSCGKENKKITHVTQIISKITRGYPIPIELLRSHNSIGETQQWTRATYLGATVKLNANDKLLVNVSNTELVYYKPTLTFFGAFLI